MKKFLEITPEMERKINEITELHRKAYQGEKIDLDTIREKHNILMELGHDVWVEMELISK